MFALQNIEFGCMLSKTGVESKQAFMTMHSSFMGN